jgi:hypothetical protein
LTAWKLPLPPGSIEMPLRLTPGRDAISFGLYAIWFAIVIGGLIHGAYLAQLPAHWIVVGAIVLLGVGILMGVKATRQNDPVG